MSEDLSGGSEPAEAVQKGKGKMQQNGATSNNLGGNLLDPSVSETPEAVSTVIWQSENCPKCGLDSSSLSHMLLSNSSPETESFRAPIRSKVLKV